MQICFVFIGVEANTFGVRKRLCMRPVLRLRVGFLELLTRLSHGGVSTLEGFGCILR